MTVVAPPPQTDADERTLDERVADLEALIEEARQRTRRRRRRNAAVALAVLLAAGAAVYAGGDGFGVGAARSADGDIAPLAALDRSDAWTTPTGPPGFGGSVLLHPTKRSVVFLNAGGRAYRSTNAGRSWTAGPRLASRVDVLTIDPRNGSTLYAGTSEGVLKSTDAGRSWRRLGLAPPPDRRAHAQVEGYVYRIEIDPANSRTVYAQTYSGLYRSANAGASWSKLQSVPRGRTVTALAVDPSVSTTLYIAAQLPWTDEKGTATIRMSADGGRTWQDVARHAGTVESLTIDPRPGTVWATGSAGVLVTRDGGITWGEAGRAPGQYPGAVVVDARHPGTIYLPTWQQGLFRSTDDGVSWKPFSSDVVDGLVIDAREPSTIYASDGFGIVKSADGGTTWRRADAGIVASSLNAVGLAPSNAATIYAGGSFGLARSGDRGRTWTGLRRDGVATIGVDPHDDRHVLVGGGSIVASLDGGITWTNAWLPPGKEYDEVRAFAFDAEDPKTVYAGTTISGLLRSGDGGRSWRPVNGGPQMPLSLAAHPTRGGTVYAGGAGGIVARSTDSGASWLYRSLAGPSVNVEALAVAPSRPGTLYAATSAGLARSVDSGDRWRLTPVRSLDLNAVAVDPKRADTVYVASEQGGVLRSTDGGVSWRPFGKGLPSRSIATLTFDATGTVLYAGTNGAGLTSIRVR